MIISEACEKAVLTMVHDTITSKDGLMKWCLEYFRVTDSR